MLVDSHCHLDRLDLAPFGGRFDALMEASRAAGVGHILCVSISLEEYPGMLALVEGRPDVSVSVGVHPNEQDCREPSVEDLVALAGHPQNVAIGETGLDYFRSSGDLGWQHDRFRRHIAAARQARKPLVVHCRNAAEDTLRIFKEEDAGQAGGVMHCFAEDWPTARAALDLGLHISFSGIVTFRNADALREVAAKVPADRLLIETDAPYLAPVPHRGRPNLPAYLRHVADTLAEVRGCAPEALVAQTHDNFFCLFPQAPGS
jgi:TatD DNase family protein